MPRMTHGQLVKSQVVGLIVLVVITLILKRVSQTAWVASSVVTILWLMAVVKTALRPPTPEELDAEAARLEAGGSGVTLRPRSRPANIDALRAKARGTLGAAETRLAEQEAGGALNLPERLALLGACMRAYGKHVFRWSASDDSAPRSFDDGDFTLLARARTLAVTTLDALGTGEGAAARGQADARERLEKTLREINTTVAQARRLAGDIKNGKRTGSPGFEVDDFLRRLDDAFPPAEHPGAPC